MDIDATVQQEVDGHPLTALIRALAENLRSVDPTTDPKYSALRPLFVYNLSNGGTPHLHVHVRARATTKDIVAGLMRQTIDLARRGRQEIRLLKRSRPTERIDPVTGRHTWDDDCRFVVTGRKGDLVDEDTITESVGAP